jgi:hypothetical protein
MEPTATDDYEGGYVGKAEALSKQLDTEWNYGNWYGLRSKDETTRPRAIAFWSVFFILSTLFGLLILFLVTIPAVVQVHTYTYSYTYT